MESHLLTLFPRPEPNPNPLSTERHVRVDCWFSSCVSSHWIKLNWNQNQTHVPLRNSQDFHAKYQTFSPPAVQAHFKVDLMPKKQTWWRSHRPDLILQPGEALGDFNKHLSQSWTTPCNKIFVFCYYNMPGSILQISRDLILTRTP